MKTTTHSESMKQLLARVRSEDVWNRFQPGARHPKWVASALSSIVAATDGEDPQVVNGALEDGVARLIVLTDNFFVSLSCLWSDDVSLADYAATVTPLRRLQGLTVGTDDEIVNDADDAGWPRWMHLVLHFEDDTRVSLPMQSEGVPSTRRELAQFLPVLVAHTRGA